MTDAKKLYEHFTAKMEERRLALGYSLRGLAERAGTSKAQVKRLVDNSIVRCAPDDCSTATLRSMVNIANALDYDLEIVLKDKKPKSGS